MGRLKMSDLVNPQYHQAPPSFTDFKMLAKDLYEKNYYPGLFHFDVKTTTASGIGFDLFGCNNYNTGNTLANLTTRYVLEEAGFSLVCKWKTSNVLVASLEGENLVMEGMKLGARCIFEPYTGKRTANLTGSYKMSCFNITCDLEAIDENLSFIVGAVGRLRYPYYWKALVSTCDPCTGETISQLVNTTRCHNFIGGYQISLDVQKRRLTHTSMAVGYYTTNFFLHTSIEDGSIFGTSIFQKQSNSIETGVLINYNKNENKTLCTLGLIYKGFGATTFRTKVSSSGLFGVSVSQRYRPEMGATISCIMEGRQTCTPILFGIGAEFSV